MSFLTCYSLHSLHIHLFCRLVLLQNSWVSREALLPIALCLLWSGLNIFSLGVTLLLFHKFKWFNVHATPAHHCIIQMEMDEFLAKGAIDPSSGGAGFYSNIFVTPNCMSGYHPILHLRQFNYCMYIFTFKIPDIRQVCMLIEQENYALSIDIKDVYLHIHIIKYHHNFYSLYGKMNLINERFYHFGCPWPLGFSPSSLCPFCSFAIARVCIVIIFMDDILVLTNSKHDGKGIKLSCALF